MKKLVILLTAANRSPASELLESLSAAGISVLLKDLADIGPGSAPAFDGANRTGPRPMAVLFELPPEVHSDSLRLIASQAKSWSGTAIVGCRPGGNNSTSQLALLPDNESLKRLGFNLVADSPAQLPALLRQVEDAGVTGELKLPEGFKCAPDTRAFSLPTSLKGRQLRGAFALLSSLQLASNQKDAAVAAVAGVARLVTADRWAISLVTQGGSAAPLELEPLVGRSFSGELFFDAAWQRELIEIAEPPAFPSSSAAREAVNSIRSICRTEHGERVVAVPLVNNERVLGVLEGVRPNRGARSFSQTETAFLAALAIPIAASLSNSVRIAEAERSSLTDDLTRLHNARYLRQFLVNEIKRARRYSARVAALFLDLDDFKRVNDVHGHMAGSHALMEVAAAILPSVRDTDCVVRYGGDEFVIILPDTGQDEAVQVAERIRLKIERQKFTGGRRLQVSLTASLGIAVFPQHALSPRQLIVAADRAMYQAKAAGKNCVRVIDGAEPPSADTAGVGPPAGQSLFQRIPGEKLI
jgi:diguanylate cyclase (GGDEF)-like protein